MAELELPLESIRTDLAAVDEYQRKIFEQQLDAEDGFGFNFVSDRAFDNLAYAAEHSTVLRSLMKSPEFEQYTNSVGKGGTVFFVRPQKSFLKDDGVREKVSWDGIVRIDGMIKILLEYSGVPYMPINTDSMQERCRIVDFILGGVRT